MSSFLNSTVASGASSVNDIKTSGAEARSNDNVKYVSSGGTLKGGKRNKSRKNRTLRRIGGKKNVGGKRKSAKKSRSRK